MYFNLNLTLRKIIGIAIESFILYKLQGPSLKELRKMLQTLLAWRTLIFWLIGLMKNQP